MKLKYLLLNIALLNEEVPSLVESFLNTPADIERFNQRVESEENFGLRFIQATVPSYVTNPSQEWIQGYIDPLVRVALEGPEVLQDEEAQSFYHFRVVVLNDPRQGFTVAVIPNNAHHFRLGSNLRDETTDYTHFQDALFSAQGLRLAEGVTCVDIDVFDKDGNLNGSFSYYDNERDDNK